MNRAELFSTLTELVLQNECLWPTSTDGTPQRPGAAYFSGFRHLPTKVALGLLRVWRYTIGLHAEMEAHKAALAAWKAQGSDEPPTPMKVFELQAFQKRHTHLTIALESARLQWAELFKQTFKQGFWGVRR
jgi:hypothetical protein